MDLTTELVNLAFEGERSAQCVQNKKSHSKDRDLESASEQLKLKQERFLSINAISKNELDNLIEPNERYARWVRVLVLRILLNTSALGKIKSKNLFLMTKVFEYLGFENMEAFASKRELSALRQDLALILSSWEEEFRVDWALPSNLDVNLSRLSDLVDLSKTEKQVLGLAILLHAEAIIQDAFDVTGGGISAFSIPRIFAPVLGLKTSAVEEAFDDHSSLMKSGLLSLDHFGEGDVRSRVDLITRTFGKRAVMKQNDIHDLIKGFVVPAQKSSLTLDQFEHISDRVQTVQEYLGTAIREKSKGVNILIYGSPGTGKTEFAKLISEVIGVDLMEVSAMDLRGRPISPMYRIRNYRLIQSLFNEGGTTVLFDECEEILSGGTAVFSDNEASQAQKSWINHALENNKLPAIWIANSIDNFDPAYIRRFDLCFEMPLPNELKRCEMLTQLCGNQIDHDVILEIAKNQHTSPALVAKTSQVVKALSSGKTQTQLNDLALMLVNDKLQAQGVSQVQSSDSGALKIRFNPAMINSPVNLESLRAGIASTGEARICLYGPPGTGKTAFGKWLADSLAMHHLVLKASDLLGSRVGETEHYIARAFVQAKREKALLQFDEVDTFLSSRASAKQSWEISMVNEMLTQMESFKGVFIASTNLFESLDEAALRRFDISLKFGFMSNDKAWEMFQTTCKQMELEVDETLLPEFGKLVTLTPGDFEQIGRQCRFIKPNLAIDILHALQKAVGVKQCAPSRHIGFI